ncbi:MAG: hypothetical protein H7X97_03895 [Opitutaceae bacterium]|nr:hypothetical protein [Verrucomicrobiales bacterium]
MAFNKECISRRPGWFLPILLFLLLSAASPLRAALQFDVFLGYGDVVSDASWFPAVFEIKNDGTTFQGVIEISNMQMGQGQTRRVPVELPTGTLKRVVTPVFCSAIYEGWNFRLLDERGRVKAEHLNRRPTKMVVQETLVVGAVARTQAGLPIFPTIKANQPERQPVAGRMQTALFPDNPIALEGCDLIYLNSEAALALTTPQAQALFQWLMEGGHLVVGVEQLVDLNGLPWLKGILPMRLASTTMVKPAASLEQWIRTGSSLVPAPATAGRPRTSQGGNKAGAVVGAGYQEVKVDPTFQEADLAVVTGTVLDGVIKVADGSMPLIVEAPRGRGRITLLTFNTEREPFLSWKNKSWFWARLGEVPARLFDSGDFFQRGGWSVDGLFGAMIDSKQVRKLPLAWLLLLLVAYLLVIGPFDRYWLKKINRQMLTWITFPCYVVFFSALIYFIGFKLRAGDSELNELNFVDVLPGSVRGRTFTSIYSPANNRYSLAGGQKFSAMRGEFMGGHSRGGESSQGDIIARGNSFEASVFVPVWTSQLFVSDWLEPVSEKSPLTVKVTSTAGGWKVIAENSSANKLTDAHVIIDRRIYPLGELPAGAPKEFTLKTGQGTALTDFAKLHGGQFLGAVQQRRQTFGNSRSDIFPNLAYASMGASFVSLVTEGNDVYQRFVSLRGLDLASEADADSVILLAWDAGHSVTKPFNRFEPRRLRRDTLFRLVAPLNSTPVAQ